MRYSLLPYFAAATGLIVCLGTSQTGFAAEKLYVQSPARYDKGATIDAKVKEECRIESRISYFVKENTLGKFDVVFSAALNDAGNNKALSLVILSVEGAGGGVWTGAKGMTVRGTLRGNGKVIGSFDAKRLSGGGGYWSRKKFQGTCELFENSAKEIGEDVASWLKQPSMDAKLGEMK
jgi:hypothetical protein